MSHTSNAASSISELIALLDRRQYDPACKVQLEGVEYLQLREAALSSPSGKDINAELLEACYEALAELGQDCAIPCANPAHEKIRAAIKKARHG